MEKSSNKFRMEEKNGENRKNLKRVNADLTERFSALKI